MLSGDWGDTAVDPSRPQEKDKTPLPGSLHEPLAIYPSWPIITAVMQPKPDPPPTQLPLLAAPPDLAAPPVLAALSSAQQQAIAALIARNKQDRERGVRAYAVPLPFTDAPAA